MLAVMPSTSAHDAVSSLGTARRSNRSKDTSSSSPLPPTLIERINSLPLESIQSLYLPSIDSRTFTSTFDGKPCNYRIDLHTSTSLPADTFTLCFNLLEENMSASYKATSLGWHPRKKQAEMKHPAMRYLVLSQTSDPQLFIGFLSFMITEEEGSEVIYTYELDIVPSHQKVGLGTKLLYVAEAFGKKVGVEKAMLTVFDINDGARRFYEREGYVIDEISPDPKVLRNGLVKQPCYHILSKAF